MCKSRAILSIYSPFIIYHISVLAIEYRSKANATSDFPFYSSLVINKVFALISAFVGLYWNFTCP